MSPRASSRPTSAPTSCSAPSAKCRSAGSSWSARASSPQRSAPSPRPNITFTGYLERRQYVDAVRNAKAMVFAGCEDFGIALAEAQASGTPLIAFAQGGARDIVRPLGTENPTGVLFPRQSVESIRDAVEIFERNCAAISPSACRQNAQRFSSERFDREILAAVAQALAVRESDLAGAPAALRGDRVRAAS